MEKEDFSSITQERFKQISELISTEENFPALTLETLLDTFVAVYTDCKAASNQTEQISTFLTKFQSVASKLETTRLNTRDFDTIKTLATGAVGKVCLVKSKKTGQVYAMKILKKHDLLTRQEAAFFMEERNVLVFSQKSEWITTLYASFQDEENLYLVMEYVSGASFRAFMNNRETIMEEKDARFYIAEMVLALADLHDHRYIHRDVKPENYLLDSTGHIKLADFGSCIRLVKDKVSSQIAVGTPDYISPEILRANEGHSEYGLEVDWWSLGIILYELLCDEVPFYSESLAGTYGKIMNHENTFVFPDDIALTEECKDLISKLICKSEKRLGVNGVNDIKSHPWFQGIDWNNIRKSTAPFIPELSGPEDTRYFEDEENETKKFVKKTLPKTKEFSGNSLAFVGYGYVRNATAQVIYPSGANAAIATSSSTHELEKEIGALKEAQNKAKGSIAKLEETIHNLTAEKKKLDSEKEAFRAAKEQALFDNMELETKVSSLKKISSEAAANSILIQELNEFKSRVEKELEDAKLELQSYKEESAKLQLSLKDISKGKSNLETKFKETVDGIQSIQAERDTLAEKLRNSSIMISQKSQELGEATSRAVKLSNDLETVTADLKSKSDIILEKQTRITEQNEQIRSLEKELALLKLDQNALSSKISTLKAENESLVSELVSLKQLSTPNSTSSEVEALESQIVSLQQIKTKLSDELVEVSKIKATVEVELAIVVKDKLDVEREKLSVCELLQAAELRIAELTKSFEELQSEKLQNELKLSSIGIELERSQKVVVSLQSAVEDFEGLLVERENLYSALNEESQAVAGKLLYEKERASALDDKLKKTETDLACERKLRLAAEGEQSNANSKTKRLELELQALQTNFKILQIDVATQKSAKEEANQQLADISSTLQKVQFEKNELSEFYTITQNELNDAKSEIDRCHSKIDELSEKLTEYEKQNSAMKTKVEVLTSPLNRENTTGSMDMPQRKISSGHTARPGLEKLAVASKSTDKLFSRSRMSAMFFKSKDNLGESLSPEKGVPPDDRHLRVQTRQSQISSTESVFPKIPTNLTILDFFNPLDGLSGVVKVPKGGKIKKGWTSIFLAFTQDKLVTFNSQDDFLKDRPGKVVCEISCEIFVARSVSQNELIHATAKEIDLIFKIQAYTPKHSNLTSEELEAKQKRIDSLKESISLEEKMLEATQKILDVTSESQKMTVISQIDAANKRLRAFKSELEKLTDPERKYLSLSELDPNTEAKELKKELEAQIQDEQKKREFLTQLAVADKKKHKHSHSEQAKDIEVELLLCDRLIAKLKEQIDILNSNNMAKKQELLDKTREKRASSNVQGHAFCQRQYFKPTDCGICCEPLWDSKNVGLECSSCKLICHKDCGAHLDVSCANQSILKNIPPLYFMAQDATDRSRWLAGLQYFRKNTESIGSKDPSHPMKTFVEPVVRMSMMPARKAIQ